MAAEQSINILYIAGAGRSGSTLLGDVLGLLPGALHVGELLGTFDYAILPDSTISCSCGCAYELCVFWRPIFEFLYGKSWREHFATLRMEGKFPRSMKIPVLRLRKWFVPSGKLPLQENIHEIVRLVSFLRTRFGVSTIVDTSKSASFAWFLSQNPNIRLIVVHLVRDPRATVFSWMRRAIPIHDAKVQRAIVRTRGQSEAIGYWIRANMGAWLLKFCGIPYLRIRYESFVEDPVACLRKIIRFAGTQGVPLREDETVMSSLSGRRIPLGERHLIGSNPGVKSKSGFVTLKEDAAWLSEISYATRLLWTVIFLPWLLWLRYGIWPQNTQNGKTRTTGGSV